jgi:dihydrofolate reductase
MRKIINSTYITLDGVVESPHTWPALDRPADGQATEVQTALLEACDAVLMGRRTYDVFAPAWQTRSGDALSDRMNTMPKYVVSKTLQGPEWANTSVIADDVAGAVKTLKEEPGQDIVQYGFGSVSTLLMEHGLLDELRLWIYPQCLGGGDADDLLFQRIPQAQFELSDTVRLDNGIAINTYRLIPTADAPPA